MTAIPEPLEVATNGVPSLTVLQRLMDDTHKFTRFWALQKSIMRWSGNLMVNSLSREQDPKAWAEFVQQLILEDDKLVLYDNFWPVRVSWDHRVDKDLLRHPDMPRPHQKRRKSSSPKIHRRRGRPRKNASKQPSGPRQSNPRPPSSRASTSRMRTGARRRMFVGKPPPDLRKGAVIRFLEPSPTPAIRLFPEIIEIEDSDDETPTSSSTRSISLSTATLGRFPTANVEAVPVGCFECGRPIPQERAGPSLKLHAAVGHNPEHLSVLFNAGLVDDHHLDLFLGWERHCRLLFFENLETSSFIRQALARKLRHPGDDPSRLGLVKAKESGDLIPAPSSPLMRVFSGILQPGADAEEEMTDPSQPLGLLFEAMELGGNRELFEEVLSVVRLRGFDYLATYYPTKELFEHIVGLIAKEKLVFERYENHWPIRFMLKRMARRVKCKPKDGHLGQIYGPPSHQVSSPDTVLPWIQYTCPIHSGADVSNVSDDVKRVLHSRGLSEFIPLFASVGIRSCGDLQQFCAFSFQEKDNVFTNRGEEKIKLNVFQRIALSVEFNGSISFLV